jgi:ABC-type long-subunit fatty acid transport system fused permease/ATPase subunit
MFVSYTCHGYFLLFFEYSEFIIARILHLQQIITCRISIFVETLIYSLNLWLNSSSRIFNKGEVNNRFAFPVMR